MAAAFSKMFVAYILLPPFTRPLPNSYAMSLFPHRIDVILAMQPKILRSP